MVCAGAGVDAGSEVELSDRNHGCWAWGSTVASDDITAQWAGRPVSQPSSVTPSAGRVAAVVAESLLASGRTPTRATIVDFVDRVITAGGPDFVTPAERVAVFDNDGTLWSEKPIPIQLDFTLYRMAELAEADPSLKDHQPYKAAVERDYRWLGEAMVKHYHGDDDDLHLLMAAVETAFGGMTVDAFRAEVTGWLQTASHPQLHRPYLSCAFVPMIELLRYLEANGFSAYIASGGDRDFMRPFAERAVRHPARESDRQRLRARLAIRATRTPICCTSPRSTSLTTVRRSRCASGAEPAAVRCSPGATQTVTSPCCVSPATRVVTACAF